MFKSIEDFVQNFVFYVKDNYHNDKTIIVNAINEFCVDNDIDYEIDIDALEEEDGDIDPTFYDAEEDLDDDIEDDDDR